VRGPADGCHVTEGDDRGVYPDQRSASVGDVMHRGVVSCSRETPATKVALMMTAHRIHAVVVTGSDDLPRLVTDAEIASALYSDALELACAGDIATCAPLLRLSDTVDDALARMHEGASTHAVAVDRAFRPVGVVSVLDLVERRGRRESG
jgi:CBS domain-containing protein